ncbi:hypothetical protein Bbelb_038590 [Branchiostoma belcheri]|nr:hypothetical protein Bbelb_038590 [Branchiostoma belcheri]
MEVCGTEVVGNSDIEDGNTYKLQERAEKKPPCVQESAKSTGSSAQAGLPGEGDELEELYENRKAAVPAPVVVEQKDRDFLATQDAIKNATAQPFYDMDITPADEEHEQPFYKMDVTNAKDTEKQGQPFYEMKVASADAVRPKEKPRPPADVSCRPPDTLYVRRVGLRFWCTKRILDWQRQALRAREDPEAVLKPVREYGEESVLQNSENGEIGSKGDNENEKEGRHYENEKEHRHYENDREHGHYENEKEHGHYENDREHGHYENEKEHRHYENDREHGHYENEKEHGHYENDREHGHYENEKEHGHYENDREHGHYENEKEHRHYENDREHGHYENEKEHGHYENDREHGHYENDEEHKYYQYDKNHAHYENDKHYENDREHRHYENDEEHKYYQYDENHAHYENDKHYENDREHRHYENDEEHKYYQYDKNHARYENDKHYENDREHRHYENDEEHKYYQYDKNHAHYENDEEHSNLSTHVYADLDPDFLAAQDAIKDATAQPFYEMDITPACEEQEQPFYKMDITDAKDKQQEQPFYEMNVAPADDNSEQVFYRMDADQLAQPTPSENAYEDLDRDFLAAQDAVDRRHGAKEPSRVRDDSDDQRSSQNCRLFCRSRPGRMVALCVGLIIFAGIAATTVALILNTHGVLSVHPDEDNVVNQTSLPVTISTSSALLTVTSQATSETTEATDWWRDWTLYVRAYFQQNRDTAAGLEERYPDNEVVKVLLEDRFFWPFVCQYWKIYNDLPHTLDRVIGYGIEYGITSDYMESHGLSAYSEFFSSMLNALQALVNLFPYLEGITDFHLINCRISPDAATLLAGQLHWLHRLTKLNLMYNKIGDEGLEAIAETFPHLKELRLLNIARNSVTHVGGRAMARSLVHLQQLQELYIQENELALSVSALAKAFANMTRLEHVIMWPVSCRSLPEAAEQVRHAVHTLAGQVKLRGGTPLYDGSSNTGGTQQGVDAAWRRVKDKLTSGVVISNRQLKVEIKLLVLGAGRYPPRG